MSLYDCDSPLLAMDLTSSEKTPLRENAEEFFSVVKAGFNLTHLAG